MTYPGWKGIKGPGMLTNIGQQVRQSHAGAYPGTETFSTVVDTMGSNAPAWAVTAGQNTVLEEVADNPHPIEAENFELDFDQATLTTADFTSAADLTGKGGS